MACWFDDFSQAAEGEPAGFRVFVDMRTLAPLDKEGQANIQLGQRQARQKGMARSVVILSSPVTTMQLKHIATSTGICEWERYVDASKTPDWKTVGFDWIEKAIDPNVKRISPQDSTAPSSPTSSE